jgi:hypothetical protein
LMPFPFLIGSPSASAVRGRAAVLWGLATFICGQLALVVVLERYRPDLCDPEYGCRLDRLQAQIAVNPGRPLVVALGSSRLAMGLRPEGLGSGADTDGNQPIVFNMGLTSSGPIMNLLCLRRLLSKGIHPQYLLVEVLAPCLYWDGKRMENDACVPDYRLRWIDLPCLQAYAPRPWNPYLKWGEEQMAPSYSSRFCLLNYYLPAWVPADVRMREPRWEDGIDAFGWLSAPVVTVTSDQYQKGVAAAYRAYGAPFDDWFRVSPVVEQAMRELLETCRRERISVVLLLMPEGSDFRSWYTPATKGKIDSFLDGLCEEYAIPLVNASGWLPDDCFKDGHHLLRIGADRFSERLGREVVRPLLAGKLVPGRLAQHASDRDEPR